MISHQYNYYEAPTTHIPQHTNDTRITYMYNTCAHNTHESVFGATQVIPTPYRNVMIRSPISLTGHVQGMYIMTWWSMTRIKQQLYNYTPIRHVILDYVNYAYHRWCYIHMRCEYNILNDMLYDMHVCDHTYTDTPHCNV